MSWLFLALAICLEVFGTILMKLSNGLTQWLPALLMFVSYVLCFTFLSFSLKGIPLGIAYAIWAALGVVLVSLVGIAAFHEPVTTVKIVSIIFIVIGVIGLKLAA